MIFPRPDLQNAADIYYFESGQFLEQIGNLSNNVWSYWLWVVLGVLLCIEVFLWKRATPGFSIRSSEPLRNSTST
jgi:uncharacterized protein (DUF58 family)